MIDVVAKDIFTAIVAADTYGPPLTLSTLIAYTTASYLCPVRGEHSAIPKLKNSRANLSRLSLDFINQVSLRSLGEGSVFLPISVECKMAYFVTRNVLDMLLSGAAT